MPVRMQSPDEREGESREQGHRAELSLRLQVQMQAMRTWILHTRAGGQKYHSPRPQVEAFNYQVKENLTGRLHE